MEDNNFAVGIITILALVILFLPMIIRVNKFRGSGYSTATGNNFFGTIGNKGLYGEYLIYGVLKNIDVCGSVIPNVYIPVENCKYTEVDVIMVNETGIYVFESKNYSGWIFGNERNKMWTQVLGKRKNRFYNPILQNKRHIEAITDLIERFVDVQDLPVFSYIVFSERCELKDITLYDKRIKVIKRNHLAKSVKMDTMKGEKRISDLQVTTISNLLQSYSNVDASTKSQHINNIKQNVRNT